MAQLTKILAEANTKIDELTRARDKWHHLYWEVQQEIAVLRTQTWLLCDECTTVKDETPEGKTFERCFRCTPDADKTRLLEIAETEARYWRESYDHLFEEHQELLYNNDARGAYDTCR